MSHATTPVVTALPRAVRAQARVLAAHLPSALGGDATSVHRARVASRRLREALAALPAVAEADKLRKDVRRITRALGPVRELDVALVTLEAESAREAFDRDAVADVRRFVERERLRRIATMVRTRVPALDAVTDRADRVADATVGAPVMAAETRLLRKRLRGRAAALTAAIGECGALYAPERMHAVRIATKKLRYAAEIAQASRLWPLSGSIRTLKRMQEDLGTLHDLQVLVGCVDAAAQRRRRSGLARGLRDLVDGLERDCRARHAALLPRLPKLAAAAAAVGTLVQPEAITTRPRMLSVRRLAAPRRRVV